MPKRAAEEGLEDPEAAQEVFDNKEFGLALNLKQSNFLSKL